jgi:hypothetical protein
MLHFGEHFSDTSLGLPFENEKLSILEDVLIRTQLSRAAVLTHEASVDPRCAHSPRCAVHIGNYK